MEYTVYEDEYEGTFRTYTDKHVCTVVQEMDNGSAYLVRIDVDEGFRNQGIGTAAIREILGSYDSLYCAPDNADSARLYARLGEKIVGEDAEGDCPIECMLYVDQGFGVYEVY